MKIIFVNKTFEARDTISLFFKTQNSITWQAGQYIIIKLNNQERQFTIASSPTEGELLQITVRIKENSEFKQYLNNLKIGDEVEASGPFGSFTISLVDHSSNHLFLAGGIGITPFRSMIKYNVDNKLNIPMFLIYSNTGPEFIFKEELDKWQKENKFLKIYYHDSNVSGHLDIAKLSSLYTTPDIQNTIFYAVGPKNFVNSMEDILEELKVPQNNIKTEKFIGY